MRGLVIDGDDGHPPRRWRWRQLSGGSGSGDNGGQNSGGDHGDQGDQGDDNDQDDQAQQACTTANLTPGASVRGAELKISSAGAVWDKVDLIS